MHLIRRPFPGKDRTSSLPGQNRRGIHPGSHHGRWIGPRSTMRSLSTFVSWSEQQKTEAHAPQCLWNVVRIITETGLRIYKELIPMQKDQLDLRNAVVWIPDSKTPNGTAEVPLTSCTVHK
jgi:integrase